MSNINEIIDVDVKTNIAIKDKTTDALRYEVNNLYVQMESIGNIAMMMAIEAGKRLLIIKERVEHGKFENWCNENLTFSKSKAEKMMQFAKRASDKNSIFAKTEMFMDLSISKVFALLTAPEEVAETIIEENDVEAMTVRDLKEEIAELKSKQADTAALKQQITILTTEKEELEKNNSENINTEELAKAESKIEKLKKQLKDAKAKAADEKAAAEANAELEIKKATEEARREWEKEATEKAVASEEKIRHLEKKLENSNDTALAEFRVEVNNLQKTFNNCLSIATDIERKDEEKGKKLKQALIQIINSELEMLVV